MEFESLASGETGLVTIQTLIIPLFKVLWVLILTAFHIVVIKNIWKKTALWIPLFLILSLILSVPFQIFSNVLLALYRTLSPVEIGEIMMYAAIPQSIAIWMSSLFFIVALFGLSLEIKRRPEK